MARSDKAASKRQQSAARRVQGRETEDSSDSDDEADDERALKADDHLHEMRGRLFRDEGHRFKVKKACEMWVDGESGWVRVLMYTEVDERGRNVRVVGSRATANDAEDLGGWSGAAEMLKEDSWAAWEERLPSGVARKRR